MFESREILGLMVVALSNGKKLGKVIDLVVNADESRVDFLIVSQGNRYLGLKNLPFKSIVGIGRNAVTIKNDKTLKNIEESKGIIKLIEEDIQLIGKEIIMENGDLLGVVDEYIFDEKNGKIMAFKYSETEEDGISNILNVSEVLCYGFDVIVARNIAPSDKENQYDDKTSKPVHRFNGEMRSDGAVYFKERQRKFLLGKTLTRDIKGPGSKIIISQGTLITDEILDYIEDNKMFVELTQYAR